MRLLLALYVLFSLYYNLEAQEKYKGYIELVETEQFTHFKIVEFQLGDGSVDMLNFLDLSLNEIHIGNILDDVKIEVEKVDKSLHRVKIRIDANNNKIQDDKYFSMEPDSSLVMYIPKKYQNNRRHILRIKLEYVAKSGDNEITHLSLRTWTGYWTEGLIKINRVPYSIGLFDVNFDGKFDIKDAESGTNFWLDLNQNESIDHGESFSTDQLIATDIGVFTAAIPYKDGSIINLTKQK